MGSQVRVESVQLQCGSVQLPFGLTVDEIVIRGADLCLASESAELTDIGPHEAFAIVSEKNVEKYLQPLLPSAVKDAQVFIGDGLLKIAARAVIVFPISVQVYCQLEVVDGKEVYLRLHSVEPGGPVRGMLEKYLEEVNPILRASDLPLPLRFRSVLLDSGSVTLNGELIASRPEAG